MKPTPTVFSLRSLAFAACAMAACSAWAARLEVGPGRAYATIAQASRAARDGDTVEVQAGDYRGDVAVWTQRNLTLRAVGGRARLIANGASAERKAIWVVRGDNIRIDGFDFSGARVADRNGAGIRFESGRLTVVNSSFVDNENGILTTNNGQAELVIERSAFRLNGAGDGFSHNLYVGRIAKLTVTDSSFTDARVGHLLKSRAALNEIHRNRFVDTNTGTSSYELEFPNGGVARVTLNTIRQGPRTQNPNMVSYGAEGYSWPSNQLVLQDNTLIDDRPSGGVYLRVAPGARTVVLGGNRLAGVSSTRAPTITY
ncbi:MAG TPA: right-handed parallel beta-helix repeat-containing protein [Burkholderiaceae bacterium]